MMIFIMLLIVEMQSIDFQCLCNLFLFWDLMEPRENSDSDGKLSKRAVKVLYREIASQLAINQISIMNKQLHCRSGQSVFIGTTMASLVSTAITNPIEVAKLNFQYLPLQCPYYPHQSYTELSACSCTRVSFEGSIKSLKIALPQVLSANLMYMPLYESIRQFLFNKCSLDAVSSTFAASIASRFVVTTLSIPLESLRVRLSNEVKNNKINFDGYRITLARDIIYSAMFWSMLEYYRNMKSNGEYRAFVKQKDKNFTWKNFTTNMLPGFVFAAFCSVVTTPLDTLKTRIQSQGIKNYNIVKGVLDIYRKEGSKGLFAGVQWRVLKNGLHSSIYVFLYELYMKRVCSMDMLIANLEQD